MADKILGQECSRFYCNICGHPCISPVVVLKDREKPSCTFCGSNQRFRVIISALSERVLGDCRPLPRFKTDKKIMGIGLSDSELYARRLGKLFSYQNTFLHREPCLDITSIPKEKEGRFDFIIASEVFEHVPPPVEPAFLNLFRLLKTGGICIFSVPYKRAGEMSEHYPELFEYRIEGRKKKVLLNQTRDGKKQVFKDLRFHGGSGATLEMREFSLGALRDYLARAGFVDFKIHNQSIPEFGILIEKGDPSQVISMRKG